jgi:hypothetical protein
MSKFTSVEKNQIKNIVALMSIKRIPDLEIIKSIFDQTNKTMTVRNLTRVKQQIKKESLNWYKKLREGEYEYLYEFKERIDEITNLQKKHHEIIDSPTEPTTIKQTSLVELHKPSITLSNLYDVAPTIIGLGNDAAISIASEVKTGSTERERTAIIV